MLRGLDGARVCRVKTTRGAHALCENRDLRVSVCVCAAPIFDSGNFYLAPIHMQDYFFYTSFTYTTRMFVVPVLHTKRNKT